MSPEPPADNNGPQPIPPDKRKRLQKCFEFGSKSAATNNFDYATEMFETCVKGDPSNRLYVGQFLINLSKKYKDNKKGAGFTSAPKIKVLQGSIKKSQYSKNWQAVIETGLDILKLNPWDVSTLTAMAEACDTLNYDEAQLIYLEQALRLDPKAAQVNRLNGRALARLGHFDRAVAAWRLVLAAAPGDDEAQRAVADLAIEKTIHHGGYEGAENSTDVMADKAAKADRRSEATARLSPQEQLEKSIAKKPDDLALYIELSELHAREERHKEAVEVLIRALQASGGSLMIQERLEDAQLRHGRHQLKIAEKQAAAKKTPEAIELYKKMRTETNAIELEVYRKKSDRYPNDPGFKYELGMRLKQAGQVNEAISCFQSALGDAKRKHLTHFELGECFQHIEQYKLAQKNFEEALAATSERDTDQRKLVLYRAGKLSLYLAQKHLKAGEAQGKEELERAEKHLTNLAGLEFGYKDVPQLLDKAAKLRNKG